MSFFDFIIQSRKFELRFQFILGIILVILSGSVLTLIFISPPSIEDKSINAAIIGLSLLALIGLFGIMFIVKGVRSPYQDLFYHTMKEQPDRIVWVYKMKISGGTKQYKLCVLLDNNKKKHYPCATEEDLELLHQQAKSLFKNAVYRYETHWEYLYTEDPKNFKQKINQP